MYETLLLLILLLLITSVFGISVAYKYYKSNRINYSNSKNAILALGEFDRSFAVYMESRYKNAITDPEQIIFESIIELVLKFKRYFISNFIEESKGE